MVVSWIVWSAINYFNTSAVIDFIFSFDQKNDWGTRKMRYKIVVRPPFWKVYKFSSKRHTVFSLRKGVALVNGWFVPPFPDPVIQSPQPTIVNNYNKVQGCIVVSNRMCQHYCRSVLTETVMLFVWRHTKDITVYPADFRTCRFQGVNPREAFCRPIHLPKVALTYCDVMRFGIFIDPDGVIGFDEAIGKFNWSS